MNAIEKIEMPSRNVFQRLSDARAEFHTLKLKKTGHNKFAGYYYFELGDFLIPALDVFRKHGLIGIVSFEPEMAEMRITNMEDTKEQYVINSPMSSAALKGCHEVQNLGAVQTYLRRYLWVAALEIVEHDAIDASEPIDKAKKPKTVAKMELEAMPEDEQKFLADLAAGVLEFWPDEQETYSAYMKAKKGLDTDEQTAFWSFFDSKQRSAIKRIGQMELAGAM